MNQSRALHPLGKCDNILRAHHVCPQRAFESGIESDVAGAVEDDIDVVGDSLRLLLAVAKIGLSDVAAKHLDLVANEPIQRASITLAKGVEMRRGNHTFP